MKHLIVLNNPPYGTERCYNGLRLAHALLRNDPNAEVTVFLMADSVACAKKGQNTLDGDYNLERTLKRVLSGKGEALLRGTCMDARGLAEDEVINGARRSTMAELTDHTLAANRVSSQRQRDRRPWCGSEISSSGLPCRR